MNKYKFQAELQKNKYGIRLNLLNKKYMDLYRFSITTSKKNPHTTVLIFDKIIYHKKGLPTCERIIGIYNRKTKPKNEASIQTIKGKSIKIKRLISRIKTLKTITSKQLSELVSVVEKKKSRKIDDYTLYNSKNNEIFKQFERAYKIIHRTK